MRKSQNIASFLDLTLLRPEASRADILNLCEVAKKHEVKGVCVAPAYLKEVAEKLSETSIIPIAVVGFPLGSNCLETKVFEAQLAVKHGAKELDVVLNLGLVKSGKIDESLLEIVAIKAALSDTPLKIIIETSLLTPEEIRPLSERLAMINVAFVKTSTGFGQRGASLEDIRLIRLGIEDAKRVSTSAITTEIKASGGIGTAEMVRDFIAAGATRIGTSKNPELLKTGKS